MLGRVQVPTLKDNESSLRTDFSENHVPNQTTTRKSSRTQSITTTIDIKDAGERLVYHQALEKEKLKQHGLVEDDIELQKLTLKQIRNAPYDYIPFIFFSCSSVIGLITFFCLYAGLGGGALACVLLVGVSCWATSQLKGLIELRDELEKLVKVRDNLRLKVNHLDQEVEKFDQQNELFNEETHELDHLTNRMRQEVHELQDVVEEIEKSKKQMLNAQEELQSKIEDLNNNVSKLQGQRQQFHDTNIHLEETLDGFRRLDDNMRRIQQEKGSEKTTYDDILNGQSQIFDAINERIYDEGKALLHDLFYELVDGRITENEEESLSEDEFHIWYSRLPFQFKEKISDPGAIFDKLKNNENLFTFDEALGTAVVLILGEEPGSNRI